MAFGDATPVSLAWTDQLGIGSVYGAMGFWGPAKHRPGDKEIRDALRQLDLDVVTLDTADGLDFSHMFGGLAEEHALVNITPTRPLFVWEVIKVFQDFGAMFALVSTDDSFIVNGISLGLAGAGQGAGDTIEDFGDWLPGLVPVLLIGAAAAMALVLYMRQS